MTRAPVDARIPNDDERAGMDWWNGLPEAARGAWLTASKGSSAADAWAYFKTKREREGRAPLVKCTDEKCVLYGLEHAAPCRRASWADALPAPVSVAVLPSGAYRANEIARLQRLAREYREANRKWGDLVRDLEASPADVSMLDVEIAKATAEIAANDLAFSAARAILDDGLLRGAS